MQGLQPSKPLDTPSVLVGISQLTARTLPAARMPPNGRTHWKRLRRGNGPGGNRDSIALRQQAPSPKTTALSKRPFGHLAKTSPDGLQEIIIHLAPFLRLGVMLPRSPCYPTRALSARETGWFKIFPPILRDRAPHMRRFRKSPSVCAFLSFIPYLLSLKNGGLAGELNPGS